MTSPSGPINAWRSSCWLTLIRLASGCGRSSRFPNFIAESSLPVWSSVVQSLAHNCLCLDVSHPQQLVAAFVDDLDRNSSTFAQGKWLADGPREVIPHRILETGLQ